AALAAHIDDLKLRVRAKSVGGFGNDAEDDVGFAAGAPRHDYTGGVARNVDGVCRRCGQSRKRHGSRQDGGGTKGPLHIKPLCFYQLFARTGERTFAGAEEGKDRICRTCKPYDLPLPNPQFMPHDSRLRQMSQTSATLNRASNPPEFARFLGRAAADSGSGAGYG
ncbi:MAG: hypothetical protein PVG24_15280, partial [Gammaproteobacteria bacterium]